MTRENTLTRTGGAKERQPGSTYFGWWYFDFVTPEGIALNLVVHETDIFGLSDKKYMSASVVMPKEGGQNEVNYYKRDLKVGELADSGGRLNVPGMLVESDDGIDINLDFGGFAIQGKLTKTAPSTDTYSRLDEVNNGDLSNDWRVLIPDGDFTGNIRFGDRTLPVQARGYVDRNWGSEMMQDFVKDWSWGHFSDGKSTFIFYDLIDVKGKRSSKFFLVNGSDTLQGNLESSHLDQIANLADLNNVDIEAEVSFLGTTAKLRVSPDRLMRYWVDKDFGKFSASYLRWHSGLNLEVGGKVESLSGITEYMRVKTKEAEVVSDPEVIIFFTGLSGSGKSTLSRLVAERLGFMALDSRDMYKPLARRYGFESAREWLGVIGSEEFMAKVIDESIENVKKNKECKGFVMDAAGEMMLERVKKQFPNTIIKMISVVAEDDTRVERIARRQSLSHDKALLEKSFRDGFLLETGVSQTMNTAQLTIDNGQNSDLEGNIEQILEFLSAK